MARLIEVRRPGRDRVPRPPAAPRIACTDPVPSLASFHLPLSPVPRVWSARRRRRPRHEPNPPALVVALGEVLAPVRSAGLLAQPGVRARGRWRLVDVRGLPVLGRRAIGAIVRGQSARRVDASSSESALRSTPASASMTVWMRPADAMRTAVRAAPASGSGSRAARLVLGQRRDDAVGEDQPLEQRVRREPVGAVHAGAGHLAAGVQAAGWTRAPRGRCARRPET